MNDLREFIDLVFLVFRGMGVIVSPLSERDELTDKAEQPAVLLIKVLNYLQKIKYNVHSNNLSMLLMVCGELIILQKGGYCYFFCKLPEIKEKTIKKGSKFDTTVRKHREKI